MNSGYFFCFLKQNCFTNNIAVWIWGLVRSFVILPSIYIHICVTHILGREQRRKDRGKQSRRKSTAYIGIEVYCLWILSWIGLLPQFFLIMIFKINWFMQFVQIRVNCYTYFSWLSRFTHVVIWTKWSQAVLTCENVWVHCDHKHKTS